MSDEEVGARRALRSAMLEQQEARAKGGVYHDLQVQFAYHSTTIEGGQLTKPQVRHLFETGIVTGPALVDDVLAVGNHFRAVDLMIRHVGSPITPATLKGYHRALVEHTADVHTGLLIPGGWKTRPNQVGGACTAAPFEVDAAVTQLCRRPHLMTFEDIVDWHATFEAIRPFQDGNGRTGRLVMLEQCLANGIFPFMVLAERKRDYVDGLARYMTAPVLLRDALRTSQRDFEQRFERLLPARGEA